MQITKGIKPLLASVVCAVCLQGCQKEPLADSMIESDQKVEWPRIESLIQVDPAVEQRVNEMVSAMTLEQKVGQMMQPEIRSINPEDVETYHIGSILNGGGAFPHNNKYASPEDWVSLADEFYQASMKDAPGRFPIPIIWGTDAVHGHNNVIGATLFPHNIGLGATRNPELIKQIGAATAKEVAATGLDWTFAPTLAVVRDDRWGRTYEGYSEDPEIVKSFGGVMVLGIQGQDDDLFGPERVLSTAKHFIGDGGTYLGDDHGNTVIDEKTLRDIHGPGYFSSLAAGAQTVMISYSSWNGEKLHGHKYLITDVLKGEMGFDGFVLSDWNGVGQVKGCNNDNCAAAINAGIDMLMVPSSPEWKNMIANIISQVKSGEIPMARIDDAVTRILRVKMRAGLFEKGAPSTRQLAGNLELIGSDEHRELARNAVRESLVLLKNSNGTLPLSSDLNVLVTGKAANDISMQTGGWTISWQGTGNTNTDFPGATSIYEGIKAAVEGSGGQAVFNESGEFENKPDVAIVVLGEDAYAEYKGDIQNLTTLEYQQGTKSDLAMLKEFQSKGIPTVSVFLTGRPQWVNPEINASNAFVVAWLPGSEGAGIADLLFENSEGESVYDFTGRLSYSWPATPCQATVNVGDADYTPLYPYGFGLSIHDSEEQAPLSEDKSAFANGCELSSGAKLADGVMEFPLSGEGWDMFVSDTWRLYTSEASNEWVKVESDKSYASEDGLVVASQIKTEDGKTGYSIKWKKGGKRKVSLRNHESLNLLPYLASDTAMSVSFRVDEPPSDSVQLITECGLPCDGSLQIEDQIKAVPVGSWQELTVDLNCMAKAAVDFGKISSPFGVTTEGTLGLSIAEVKLVPHQGSKADLVCSES